MPAEYPPPPTQYAVRSLSPEARRARRMAYVKAPKPDEEGDILAFGAVDQANTGQNSGIWQVIVSAIGPSTRPFKVVQRTLVGTYQDGFIHAGNLAYLAMLAIFPFFIFAGAVFRLIGEAEERQMLVETMLMAVPPTVGTVIGPVASDVMDARSGWLLWVGAGAALWSVSSLIETIRDVLRRAYGTAAEKAFWQYRLASAGLIIGAVILMLVSFFAQVVIAAMQEFITEFAPQLGELIGTLQISRVAPALGLFGSLFLLFFTLTPAAYRTKAYPKWPGALFTAAWWVIVTTALPPILSGFFDYNLTYGSMAGIIIALLFFWLVGLGLVIGAELNAALAEPEDEMDPEHGEHTAE